MKQMKAWPCYSGNHEWYNCVLVLENGYAPYSHVCSHPYFAPGDLLLGRKDRLALFKLLGIEIIMQPICMDLEVPADVLYRNKDPQCFEEFRNEFLAKDKELQEMEEKEVV